MLNIGAKYSTMKSNHGSHIIFGFWHPIFYQPGNNGHKEYRTSSFLEVCAFSRNFCLKIQEKTNLNILLFSLSPYSLVHFLETDFNHSLFFKIQGSITEYFAKWAVVYNSAWLMAFLVFGGLIYLMVGFFINLKYMHSFLKANFNR